MMEAHIKIHSVSHVGICEFGPTQQAFFPFWQTHKPKHSSLFSVRQKKKAEWKEREKKRTGQIVIA